MRSTPSSFSFAFLLAVAATARAQNVLVVAPAPGPGVFSTQIQVATAAAQSGDVVLVKAGAYSGMVFINGKSLVLTAELGASVTLDGEILVSNVAANQRVVVRRIDVTAQEETNALFLSGNVGPVWIEECLLVGGFTPGSLVAGMGCRVLACSAVVFARCTIAGGPALATSPSVGGMGLLAMDSNLHLADTVCIGTNGHAGDATHVGGQGGAGANVAGGFFVATGSGFQGGNGGGNPTPAMLSGGAGGGGLQLSTFATAIDCAFVGGAGGVSALGQAPNGANVSGATLTVVPGTARHFALDSPAREGQTATLHFAGLANEAVGVIYGPVPSPIVPLAAFGGSLLIDAATSSGLILGALSPAGTLDLPVAMPALPASVLAAPMHLQAVFFDAPLTYAALGPPSSLLVLDSNL